MRNPRPDHSPRSRFGEVAIGLGIALTIGGMSFPIMLDLRRSDTQNCIADQAEADPVITPARVTGSCQVGSVQNP